MPAGDVHNGEPKSEALRINNEGQVEVTLTAGFWLGKCEVTKSEWKQVMKTEPWKRDNLAKVGDDFPVTFVTWEDAMEFCRNLTERERAAGRVPDGWEFTLPTEAQWERACRAGTETRFSFGDDESKLDEYAWFDGNALNASERFAHRVGQKKANPWGLYDMHGNVWEWCRDCYADKLPGGRDPEVTKDGSRRDLYRVIRGESWYCPARLCQSASRNRDYPSWQSSYYGFRVAYSPSGNK